MFGELLKRRGYVKREDVRHLDFTDEEVLAIIDKSFGDIDLDESTIDKEDEKKLFEELGAIEGLQEYLRKTLALDMKRHFAAQPIQQMLIRGAFQRTAFLRKKISERSKEFTKLSSPRHL